MFNIQDLRTGEWLPMGLGVAAFLLLGTALLILLAAFRFPSFRAFAAWCIAVAIRPERFEEGSYTHQVAWGLKRWLTATTLTRSYARQSVEFPRSYARQSVEFPRSYARQSVEHLKNPPSGEGSYEAAVLRHLHHRAVGTTYELYLPVSAAVSQGWPSTTFAHEAYSNMDDWYSATQIRRQHVLGVAGQHVAWMFCRMLEILGFVHRQGIVHGAILPQHLWFNTATHGLRLVNWTQAKNTGSPITFVLPRYQQWYPPEPYLTAGPCLDIYMAANCAMFLAGSDIGCKQIPNALPNPFGQLLRACLLESPRMRPQDAWELHRDARDLFATVFGPPEFHQLSMIH